MESALGLHVGTENLCCALTRQTNGISQSSVIPNESGDRTTPIYASFRSNETAFGLAAKHGLYRQLKYTVFRLIDFINGSTSFELAANEVKCGLSQSTNEVATFEVNLDGAKKSFPVNELFKSFLLIIFKYIEEVHSSATKNTVIACSDSLSLVQKTSLVKICQGAGFNVLRVVSEMSVSILPYGFLQDKSSTFHIACVKVGAYKTTLCVYYIVGGMAARCFTCINEAIGGNQITWSFTNDLALEFKRQSKLNVAESPRSLAKLFEQADNCKHILSTINTSSIAIDSLYEGFDFQTNVSRAKLENSAQKIFGEITSFIVDNFRKHDFAIENIDKLLCIGGSMKMPKLQSIVSALFSNAKVLNSYTSDEISAIGASQQAFLLSKQSIKRNGPLVLTEKHCSINVLPFSVLFRLNDEELFAIPPNSPLLLKEQRDFPVNDKSFTVRFFAKHALKEVLLKEFVLNEVNLELNIVISFRISPDGAADIKISQKQSDISISGYIENIFEVQF